MMSSCKDSFFFYPQIPKIGYPEMSIALLRDIWPLSFFSSDKTSTGNVSVSWLALCFPSPSSHWDRRHTLWQRTHLTCVSSNRHINFLLASVLSFNTHVFYLNLSWRKMISTVFILTLLHLLASFPFYHLVLFLPPPPPISFQPLVFLP